MKISFYTLGCKVNQYETEAMRELLEAGGFTETKKGEVPDIAVVNSCTVTAESDRKTRHALRKFKKDYPNVILVLTGCMVQTQPEEAKKLGADIVIGHTNQNIIVEKIKKYLVNNKPVFDVNMHEEGECYNTPVISGLHGRTRAFMKIEDGCERYCTYCTIPKARGPVRSRPIDNIKAEATVLGAAGYREIVLVGINLSSYGSDFGGSLADAVDAVCNVEGIARVRLGSLEPDHMSDALLDRLAGQEKFCPHFHLSLQSGCDVTLKRMNRHYDFAFYSDLISRIRIKFPNVAFTTDVMVGFPGESEEFFKESLQNVSSIGFSKVHVFPYSRREGTPAALFGDQIERVEKEHRSKIMIAVAEESRKQFLQSQLCGTYPVLFESGKGSVVEGYTPNYTRVKVRNSKNLQGIIKEVLLNEVEDDYCLGEIK